MNRKWSHGCLWGLIFAVLLTGCSPILRAEAPSVVGGELQPKHITLSWTGDPQTTQAITWQTETAETSYVQLRKQVTTSLFSAQTKTIAASTQRLLTNRGTVYVHTVALNGLKPGEHYWYRVGNSLGWSEQRTFTTAPRLANEFSFLVFGDSQSINYSTWHTTLHQAYQANSHASFMTVVGDLVDVGQDYDQWQAWFAAAKGVLEVLPIMPATGNHETYTPERKFSPPTLFTAQFSLPVNGPDGLKEQVYSFDYGAVHFVVLDSQASEQQRFTPDMLAKQKAWLEKDLAETNRKWKIVLLHRPPYDNKTFRDNAAIRKAFVPIFDKHQVDVVFTGHDHVYARTYPLYDGEKSPGGTVYVATGRSGSKTYHSASANQLNEFFYNPQEEPNYLTVDVKLDRITVKAFKQSGALIDGWTIYKTTTQSLLQDSALLFTGSNRFLQIPQSVPVDGHRPGILGVLPGLHECSRSWRISIAQR